MKIISTVFILLFGSVGFADLTLNSYGVYLGNEIKIDPTIYSSSKGSGSDIYVLNKANQKAHFNRIVFSKDKNGEINSFMHEDSAMTISVDTDNISACFNEAKNLEPIDRCATISKKACKVLRKEYGNFDKIRNCADVEVDLAKDEKELSDSKEISSVKFMIKNSEKNSEFVMKNTPKKVSKTYFKAYLCEKFEEFGVSLNDNVKEASEYDPTSLIKPKSGIKF